MPGYARILRRAVIKSFVNSFYVLPHSFEWKCFWAFCLGTSYLRLLRKNWIFEAFTNEIQFWTPQLLVHRRIHSIWVGMIMAYRNYLWTLVWMCGYECTLSDVCHRQYYECADMNAHDGTSGIDNTLWMSNFSETFWMNTFWTTTFWMNHHDCWCTFKAIMNLYSILLFQCLL